ncbi:MAG: radical SAM protein [Nanoarchaeota archaeon]|nr:radical SAM protein [Nanoarchaeota archaeon]MBU1622150.1 radical SAM protein [Nanoarchaeota archaeon]
MHKENKYYSYNKGRLPKGCQYCVKGEKLVIFITGICPRSCSYCPVSDQKYQHDVIYANERKVDAFADVVMEARLMDAQGAGITGGDPLAKLERTVEYIEKLKQEFGKEFHIHLYTSLNLVDGASLKQLYNAGLDEIRFHLDLDSDKLWDKLKLAFDYDWDVGVEVPLVIGKKKELKQMIDFINKINDNKRIFLNLNELETADSEHYKLRLETKDQLSYAVKGSLELGLELLEKIDDLNVHLCTAKLKDKIQLSERIKREAEGVKHSFDIVDGEGMLTRGALYSKELMPGFDYRKKLEQNHDALLDKLELILVKLKKKFAKEEFYLDMSKPRILCSKKLVKKKKDYFYSLRLKPAIVKEYPTADQLEIEVDFLT